MSNTEDNKTCLGRRYNFKKGMEICPNKNNCSLYKPDSYKNYLRFQDIKSFRKCDKHAKI